MEAAGLDQHVLWMHEGTDQFRQAMESLSDDALAAPSRLPGWHRSHVVTHVARNADALSNLVTWATTGVETPMYTSASQRDSDIVAGALRSADEIRRDLVDASGRLGRALSGLDERARRAEVRTAMGRTLEAGLIPWLRVREVWLHAIDLDAGPSFGDLPEPLALALVDDVVRHFSGRPDCPPLQLRDGLREWSIHPGSDPATVLTAPTTDLLACLLGRSPTAEATSGAPPVQIPRWL
jgi:maleylpyruvate isomerase